MLAAYCFDDYTISDIKQNRFYNKCWGQHRIGADFSVIFLQNKSI